MITYVPWNTWLVNNNFVVVPSFNFLLGIKSDYQGFSIVSTTLGLHKLENDELVIDKSVEPFTLFDDLVLGGYAELWLHFDHNSVHGLGSLINAEFFDVDGNKHIIFIRKPQT